MNEEQITVRHIERHDGAPAYDDADPEQIRANIERKRAEMSGTIDAIQERLNPDLLKEQAKVAIREATIGKAEEVMSNVERSARETGWTLMDTVRQNPLPAAMIGIGLGWLLVGSRRHRDHRATYTEAGWRGYESRYPIGYRTDFEANNLNRARVGGMAANAGMAASEMASGAMYRANDMKDRAAGMAGDMADRASEKASHLVDRASETASGMLDTAASLKDAAGNLVESAAALPRQIPVPSVPVGSLDEMLHENPLAVGAVAIGIGAAIGLMLPETRQEHQLLGETRDQLFDQAKHTVMETAQEAKEQVAQRVTEQVQKVAGEVAGQVAGDLLGAEKHTNDDAPDKPAQPVAHGAHEEKRAA